MGRIGRPVGLKGEVEVAVESDAPDRFAVGATVLLAESLKELTVEHVRTHRQRSIVKFADISDRTTAETLRGSDLVVEASHARALEPGEYWDHDLVGCEVVTEDGRQIGAVSDVLHTPANEVLVVKDGTAETLIPLVAHVIKAVEPSKRITIDPPPDLLS